MKQFLIRRLLAGLEFLRGLLSNILIKYLKDLELAQDLSYLKYIGKPWVREDHSMKLATRPDMMGNTKENALRNAITKMMSLTSQTKYKKKTKIKIINPKNEKRQQVYPRHQWTGEAHDERKNPQIPQPSSFTL
jgi:hypothetical protein